MFSSLAQREEIYICMSRGTTSSPLIPRFNFSQTIRYLCSFFRGFRFSRNDNENWSFLAKQNNKQNKILTCWYIEKNVWDSQYIYIRDEANFSWHSSFHLTFQVHWSICFIYCFYSDNNFHILISGKLEVIKTIKSYVFEFFNLILIKCRLNYSTIKL